MVHIYFLPMYICLHNNYNTSPHFVGEQEIHLLKNALNYTELNCTLEENEHDKKYKVE